ncbi:MAG: hypothetical protein QXX41_07640 [Nitrososphaerota archaeon]
MGLNIEAVKTANRVIDFPEKYFPSLSIEHDDGRLWAMDIIRAHLSQLYGYDGVLAADLHYSLDCIDRWLDPEESKRMIKVMGFEMMYPSDRRGVVDPIRRIWHPSSAGRVSTLPITAYCVKCEGKKKPINSPFCNGCRVNILELSEIKEIPVDFFLLVFSKWTKKRRLDPHIEEFIERNLLTVVSEVVRDRDFRGLHSLKIL